jgi:hypothetical protein
MRPTRPLSLKKESLGELATDDLRRVVGAGPDSKALLSEVLSCPAYCMSWQTEQCHDPA